MAQAIAPQPQTAAPALGVYLHIPFCKTLCPYCDFVKVRDRQGVPQEFVDALLREIAQYDGPREAQSVFFGGGTPSRLSGAQLARINDALRSTFQFNSDSEWSLEANPDDISEDALKAMADAGINRVSLGVQSFDDRVLRYLGRRHDAAGALWACEQIAAAFGNWSLDLMFGAPPLDAWAATLRTATTLSPPHMSAYGLTYEEGTPFARRAKDATPDDVMLGMYQQLEEALAAYEHYEISNFAMHAYQARHNLVYWHNLPYAGFGTGAYSYVAGVRARNHTSLERYLAAPGEKEEALEITLREEKLETVIQHLRLREGLPRERYRLRFACEVEADFGDALDKLEARGLIARDAQRIWPTREGFYLNNEIGLELA